MIYLEHKNSFFSVHNNLQWQYLRNSLRLNAQQVCIPFTLEYAYSELFSLLN
jgi:hypothetical protein